jgi:toxin ParE1/3/4
LQAHRLSRLARLDLVDITDYTLDTWGVEQTLRYLDDLEACFNRIAETPKIGRRCDRIRPGYHRVEHERHVVLYRIDADGIFIGRILHQAMLPSKHLIEDE